jgi:hypothetical protein
MDFDEQRALADRLDESGWGVIPPDQFRIDIEPEFFELWESISDFTMTSLERAYALYRSVRYVTNRDIPGDFVECGVWRGGSCMLMAKTLLAGPPDGGRSDRTIYLYDTFSGMTEPGDEDIIAWNGRSVRERFERFSSWAVSRTEVEANLKGTGYPRERLRFVEGDIVETLESSLPESIALLRLDTDWYASTAAELEVLYPLLVPGGVIILDDYGHFKGARKAVDEYFAEHPEPLFLRADYTGRVAVKV